eukprot:scaffold1439_cov404-Prasinococcus_capsulatus_cf.AAC.71
MVAKGPGPGCGRAISGKNEKAQTRAHTASERNNVQNILGYQPQLRTKKPLKNGFISKPPTKAWPMGLVHQKLAL